MDTLHALVILFPLSLTSSINFYATVLMVIAVLILVSIIIVVPRLMRWAWFMVKAVFARFKGIVRKVRESDLLPAGHAALLLHRVPELASSCKGQRIKGTGGRSGYVLIRGTILAFAYQKWFRSHLWQINLGQVVATYLRRRLLMDVLEVHYIDAEQKRRVAYFAFTKDRAPLIEQFAARLKKVGVGGVASRPIEHMATFLVPPPPIRACPNCHQALGTQARFCTMCGYQISVVGNL